MGMKWLATLLVLSWFVPLPAQPILIGMSGPLHEDIGQWSASGLAFALEEANQAGGVLGRNVTLIALNDNYNVTTALSNIHALLDAGVLILAGVVGSEIAKQALPLIVQRGVPYVGAITGTAELHTPFHREVVNVQASYADEIVAHAMYLVQYARVQRVACLYQNDSFGIGSRTSLVAALGHVGMGLVASGGYTHGKTDVEAAVAAIAGAPQKAQAVVLASLQDAAVKFISLFLKDPRVDPDCMFFLVSSAWGAEYHTQLPPTVWPQLYFLFSVPLPGDAAWTIATKFNTAYTAAGYTPDPLALQGYVTGRLIVEVLRRTRTTNITSETFLDEVYTDRMFVLDDLVVGMYSTDYDGCQQALCACNSGLRSIFASQLDPATGVLVRTQAPMQHSVLQCNYPVTSVVAPLLFGQLLPTADDGWYAVAADIGRGLAQAFAEANAAGGTGGRSYVLLQSNYSTSPMVAMANLSNRYPLVALVGSVVGGSADLPASRALPLVGTLHAAPSVGNAAFRPADLRLQPETTLEVMALARWAVQNCSAIHLRAPSSAFGEQLLAMMTQSVQSFQTRATSTATYSRSVDALASAPGGCVLAIGSDADLTAWYAALPAYPDLHLLTLSRTAMRLMAEQADAGDLPQAARLHFPTLITDAWNDTLSASNPSESWKYGYVLGKAVTQAIGHSQYAAWSYTTPAQLLDAWYTVRVMTAGSLIIGPFYDANCTVDNEAECECGEGARTVAVRTAASSEVGARYSIATCHVTYTALQLSSGSDNGVVIAIVGVVVGVGGLAVVGGLLFFFLRQRNNAEAPKDPGQPFCVLFTDIQASTHLWAVAPDVMTVALHTHHVLIRNLIAKYRCYEVKTIGDSFMCAAHTPLQAVQLALAIQTTFHENSWGSDAIDCAYREFLSTQDPGQISGACWNGLRVRVGVHYGLGDIQLDPVTKGYDYYGTTVNTAARIESVCHGGQVGVSDVVYGAVRDSLSDVVWADLGPQPLRGLTEPIKLFQALPAGPLAGRTFPALRLHKQDTAQEVMDAELEIVTVGMSQQSSMLPAGAKPNSVAPAVSVSANSTVDSWRWAETHPLVLRGDVGLEEVRLHFAVVYATLSTLLTTQTERARDQMVSSLCERLHVPNFGVKGLTLQRTLRGLVFRVLPATVVSAQQQLQRRRNSKMSMSSPLSPELPLGSPLSPLFISSPSP